MDGGFLRDLARAMRLAPTDAEETAWELLRNLRCLGLKFRRQHIIAGFIVDFYCAALRLAVEVDGRVHDGESQRWRDAERTAALGRAGVRVVRIANDQLSRPRLLQLLKPYAAPAVEFPPLRITERGTGGEADAHG